MRSIISTGIVAALLAVVSPSVAQEESTSASSDKNILNHLAVGVNIGTPGIGIDVSAPLTRYVAVRGGVNLCPVIKWSDSFYFEGVSKYNQVRAQHPELNLPETSLGDGDDGDIMNVAKHVIGYPVINFRIITKIL